MTEPAYAELHCHSYFSLLDGAGAPAELAARAAALGLSALALTDHDAVYGVPHFLRAAREAGIQPVLGAELTLAGGHHLTLLVENEAGWHNLCYLISRAQHAAGKGTAVLDPAELVGCSGGLIALSGCRQGEVAAALRRDDRPAALAAARRYRELFGPDNFFIELQRHRRPEEAYLIPRLTALAGYLGLACVATNNVHYPTPDRRRLQDLLVCIRQRTTLDRAIRLCRPNAEYCLKSGAAMAALFADCPQAVANTVTLAERCRFQLNYGLQDLPHFPTPHGMSSAAYLRRLCSEALLEKYPDAPTAVRRQMVYELEVIAQAGLSNYFLLVWDIVRFARTAGIRCQGRGSAANSLVAYLLDISPVDPLAQELVFERFLSRERQAVPDIDLDFDAARREEVIQYIYRRYGAAHTAMACTFVTFQRRSALRDVGQALGLAPELVAAALADETGNGLEASAAAAAAPTTVPPARALLQELAEQLLDFPRHLGIHAGGMVITGQPLMGRAPTEPAAMPDRVVVQWDKEALAEVGLVKIDILGLRMLSALTEALTHITLPAGQPPALPASFTDPAVYTMIGRADTIGVFQVESRAQAQMLPRLQPRSFADLVVAISLIRPGPIQGNMVHPYLRRRLGLEPVSYAHPLLEPALAETLGVILFQEQVLKVARDLAGFSAGQGEQLRRALGAKRPAAEMARLQASFLSGAKAKGVPEATAATVFEQLQAFGGYAFAKSHAAAFAVLVYQSAWLKHYHPAAFYTALLNNQPMGFWNAAVLVNEARRQGIPVRPVAIEVSQARCLVEEGGIRLGFNYVKGLGAETTSRLLASRAAAPFTSLADFQRRVRPARRAAERLILSGAMDGWGLPRRQLLWELGSLYLDTGGLELAYPTSEVALPPLTAVAAMLAEQEALGLSTGEHIMQFYQPWLAARGILDSRGLAGAGNGQLVRLAGLLVVHQAPPTAKGFHFLTLEDADGLSNVVVRPAVYTRYAPVIRGMPLLLVSGMVQRQDGVVHLLAERVAALPDLEK
jgi:error-prone DNA polymerase